MSASTVHVEAHSAREAPHTAHSTHPRVDVFCASTQIVLPTLLRITENCIRLVYILKHLFRMSFLFIRLVVFVGVPLESEISVRFFYFFIRCALLNTQNLIIVLFSGLLR